MQSIRAQIERTLKQFSTVKSVVITANGKLVRVDGKKVTKKRLKKAA